MLIAAPRLSAVPSFDLDVPEELFMRVSQAAFLGSIDAQRWLADNPRANETQFARYIAGQVGAPPTGTAARADHDEVAAAVAARTPERSTIARQLDHPTSRGGLFDTWRAAAAAAGTEQAARGEQLLRASGRLALDISSRIKDQFERPRPYVAHADLPVLGGVHAAGPSFVSGHAAYSAAAAAALGEVAPGLRKQFDELSAQISYSRVYAAAHFPTDVIGGAYVGAAAAAFATARNLAG